MDSGSGPGSSSSGPMATELFRCLYAACRVGVWQQMRSAEADCLTSAAASIVSSGAAAWGEDRTIGTISAGCFATAASAVVELSGVGAAHKAGREDMFSQPAKRPVLGSCASTASVAGGTVIWAHVDVIGK